MATIISGNWLPVTRTDERAFALYRQHYSAKKNAPYRRNGNFNIAGPGETITLITEDNRALFVWVRNMIERLDHQSGVNCAVFRNDGRGAARSLSSDLIREADALAWDRWPGERHFTYVDPAEIRSVKVMHKKPGQCFLAAGWRLCGTSAQGKAIFHILPEWRLA